MISNKQPTLKKNRNISITVCRFRTTTATLETVKKKEKKSFRNKVYFRAGGACNFKMFSEENKASAHSTIITDIS